MTIQKYIPIIKEIKFFFKKYYKDLVLMTLSIMDEDESDED